MGLPLAINLEPALSIAGRVQNEQDVIHILSVLRVLRGEKSVPAFPHFPSPIWLNASVIQLPLTGDSAVPLGGRFANLGTAPALAARSL